MKIKGILEKYSRIEFQFSDKIDYIKVLRPDNEVEIIDTFFYQPVTLKYDEEGFESVLKNGNKFVACRYTPDFFGKMVVEAYCNDKIMEKAEFEIVDSDKHGYIEIGKNDKKYFAYSDGKPFFSIGINTAFPTCYVKSDGTEFGLSSYGFLGLKQYERWFERLSKNGVNVARVWLGHEYFSPDTQNIYELSDVQFSKIDLLVELARKYNIKLKLTLEQFRFFDYETIANSNSYGDDVFRKFNKKLYFKDVKCESADHWLTEDIWKDGWLYKVKELSKRYSGDTQIFTIELWNEMNCIGNWKNMLEWNKKMLEKVKELFPKNLVVNSLGSFDSPKVKKSYDDFCWDKCDFVQIHRYLDQGAVYEDCNKFPLDVVKGAFEKIKSDKPIFIAETGAVSNCHIGPFKYYVNDDDGIIFADMVYAPVFFKSCGVGNIWHWDERYVEAKNLYKYFKPISDMVKDVDFEKEKFESFDFSDDNVFCMLLKGEKTTMGYIRNKNYNWKNILRDLKNVEEIDTFTLDIDFDGTLELFSVWDNDFTKAKLIKNKIVFEKIKIGTLFKIT